MWIAVVPAYNEAASISNVIKNIFRAPVNMVIFVANGCTDCTCSEAIRAAEDKALKILHFPEPLGVDIPKAVGAVYALKYRPRGVIFIDGDMNGPLLPLILDLIMAVESGADLALTNCYPNNQYLSELAQKVWQARQELNMRLGLFEKLGVATPSHGPHACSGSLLQQIDLRSLAVPPKLLVQAHLLSARIEIGGSFPHSLLGSSQRSPFHAEKIAATIIGDCQEALSLIDPAAAAGISSAGYRKLRRFDILEQVLSANNYQSK